MIKYPNGKIEIVGKNFANKLINSGKATLIKYIRERPEVILK